MDECIGNVVECFLCIGMQNSCKKNLKCGCIYFANRWVRNNGSTVVVSGQEVVCESISSLLLFCEYDTDRKYARVVAILCTNELAKQLLLLLF